MAEAAHFHNEPPAAPRPKAAKFLPENIPADLRDRKQWVLWKYQLPKGKSKWTKVPHNASGILVDPTLASSWCSLEEAAEALAIGGFDGVGFVVTDRDSFCGIDLDDAALSAGSPKEKVSELIRDFRSYTERTPSGSGFRVWIHGEKPPAVGCKRNNFDGEGTDIEVYDKVRFFTVTGDRITGSVAEIEERQQQLESLCARLWPTPKTESSPSTSPAVCNFPSVADDEDLLNRARAARNGGKFAALFDRGDTSAHNNDRSAADQALCNHLAFWTGCDPERVDRLFRSSALMRDKWDSPRSSSTYGKNTVDRAVANARSAGLISLAVPTPESKPAAKSPTAASPVATSAVITATPAKRNVLDVVGGLVVTGTQVEAIEKAEPLWHSLIWKQQYHVWVAPPGAGKTTIAMHAARELAAQGKTVLYFNLDAGAAHLKEYQQQAAAGGFYLLAPLAEGKSDKDAVRSISELHEADQLDNVVLFLDTLKKFTSVIDKREAKAFYGKLRALTRKGCTVIALAHSNKYKDQGTGELVYEGTGDLASDADHLMFLYPLKDDSTGELTVSTKFSKARALVEDETFLISPTRQVRLSDSFLDVRQENLLRAKEEADATVIDLFKRKLALSQCTQGALMAEAREIGVGRKTVERVLRTFEGRLWDLVPDAPNNARLYSIVTEKRDPKDLWDF